MKNKMAIAMSGGVDSAACAYLLKEKGYDLTGFTMLIGEDISYEDDAKRICNKLGIPHYSIDLRKEFEERVIEYFCKEYISGRTPNPCAICNKNIKYGLFYEKISEYGIDKIATGHYGNIIFDSKVNKYRIYRSKVDRKDQTYLFSLLSQDQLSKIYLPLSSFDSKKEVKDIVRRVFPDIAEKKESNDICFISEKKHGDFIKKRFSDIDFSGNFLDEEGNILGRHKGIFNYTIGQRRGLLHNLNKPMYVIEINKKSNSVILGGEDKLYSKGFIGKDYNFIIYYEIDSPMEVEIKVCQWGYILKGRIYRNNNEGTLKVVFNELQRAVAPGQIGVFYKNNEVIGGCIIDSVI